MKKLIVYDESCPMCRLYTKGMIAADQSGQLSRMGNGHLTNPSLLNRLDRKRARHEIPLIDLDGGETLYGVDTWIYAFGHQNHSLEKLLTVNWFKLSLQKLYAFISYNRRIIITSAPGRWQLLDLQPDFQPAYRLAFILLIFGLIGALSFAGVLSVWPPAIVGLVVAQLLVASLYIVSLSSDNTLEMLLDYTGHLGMSLLLGAVFLAINQATHWSALGLVGYALMIGQHFIRTYRLGLNPWLSVCFTLLVFLLFRPL